MINIFQQNFEDLEKCLDHPIKQQNEQGKHMYKRKIIIFLKNYKTLVTGKICFL